MKPEDRKLIAPAIVLCILLVGVFLFIAYASLDSNDSSVYKTILKADIELMEISIDGQMAESYYDEATYAYEDADYKSVESNCRLAREYYLKGDQGYKKVKAELNSKNIDDELINLYIERLDLLSEITINMYEACEYFEVAARYYDTYYYGDVSPDDLSYDMGTQEIEMMGEKIIAHDIAADKYNNVLAEFGIELERRLE